MPWLMLWDYQLERWHSRAYFKFIRPSQLQHPEAKDRAGWPCNCSTALPASHINVGCTILCILHPCMPCPLVQHATEQRSIRLHA